MQQQKNSTTNGLTTQNAILTPSDNEEILLGNGQI